MMLSGTDAFAVPVANASSSPAADVQQLPYYSTTYPTQRTALAGYMESLYNSSYDLLQGTVLCGIQTNAFSIIDENFLDGPALEGYNPGMSASIISSVDYYLGLAGYQNNDRREVLFGNPIQVPPLAGVQTAIVGTLPTCPNGGKSYTGFFITTEMPSAPAKSYMNAMNYLTVAGLGDYLAGNVSGAQTLFNTALGWWTWNATYHGFLSPAQMPCPPSNPSCASGNNFNTRDLAYFLFFARATRFQVPPTTLSEIESTLWSQQLPQYGGGIATSYSYNGSPLPKGGHTSGEINGLALLAYDPRIQTTWWPGPIQTLPTTTSVSCSPSSLPVNTLTTCEAFVRNGDASVPLLPTGEISFESSVPGSFSGSGVCNLAQINGTTEGCSVSFTPAPGGEGNQLISAAYSGDTYHSSNESTGFTISVAIRTTQLTVSCDPATSPVNAPSTCTITVSDSATGSPTVPSGSVSAYSTWAMPSNPLCALSAGKCTVQVTPSPGAEGVQALHVTYGGDQDHSGSAGDANINVTQRTSSLRIACSPSQVRHGSQVRCTVTVEDSTPAGTAALPMGSVSFSASKKIAFSPASCVLVSSGPGQASCSVRFTPRSKAVGTLTVTASFGGDQDHTASVGQATLKVR